MSKAYSFRDIQKYLYILKSHSHCETNENSYLDLGKDFLEKFLLFLENEQFPPRFKGLYEEILDTLRNGRLSLTKLIYFHDKIIRTGNFQEDVFNLFLLSSMYVRN